MSDGGPLPSEQQFYGMVHEDYVNRLPLDSVKEFLPLARKLLQDTRPEARKYALMCFLVVTLRRSLDSQELLEPYIPDLLRLADDRANPLRPMALQILGGTSPELSSKTLTYLAAHVADKDNTPQDTGWMACMLLKDGSDPQLIHDVVSLVQKQNQHDAVISVLGCLRLYPTKNADALAFVGSSLDSPDEWVRRRAVEAVERIPLVERSPFLEQLHRLATDPRQPTEIRSGAAEALKK